MRALVLIPLLAACHHPEEEWCRHAEPCTSGGIRLCVQPATADGRTVEIPPWQDTLVEADERVVATRGDLGWYRGTAPLRHTELPPFEVVGLAAADVDGDGDREILVASADSLTIANTSGAWLTARWTDGCALVDADADCDGDLDLIARCPDVSEVFLRQPDGTFTRWDDPSKWARRAPRGPGGAARRA